MRCCVPFCKNAFKNSIKSEETTFYFFPNDAKMKTSWLSLLGLPQWVPRSLVCSDHFKDDDICEVEGGERKLLPGAVPKAVTTPVNSTVTQVCRICLGAEMSVYPILNPDLQQTFILLTGMNIYKDDYLPQNLCIECMQRLKNCYKFRTQTLQAQTIIVDLIRIGNFTTEAIKSLNHNPKWNLQMQRFDANHCDAYINKEDVNPIQEIVIEEQVKIEKEFINEQDTVAMGYTTDDSLPLETQRTKAKKTKKKKEKKIQEPKVDRRRKPFLNDDLNESLFTITDLTLEEQIADIQKRQESSNFKNSVYKCMECFKGFLDEGAYNGHMTRHTTQCGEYCCEICKTHFKHSHALRKHTTAHHAQRFNCNRCAFVTTHRQTARLHERWHKGTKYECPHCNEVFLKFTTYMGHIRIKHPSDFVCALCGYCFVSQKGIDLHKKLKHRLHLGQIPEDGPLCELCDVRFISQEAYKRHLSVSARHAGDEISKDPSKPKRGRKSRDALDKDDSEKNDLNDKKVYPSQVRKAEGPIPCEQCGMQLEDSRAYHAHFRRNHPDKNRTNYPSMKSPCMCEVCGRMFQSHALLKDHRWVHTNERPFACECGKRFRMKQRLVAHRRVHRQTRHYTCALCGKGFSTHSNRQRHMIIHTGLKPFKCEMCGKCFKHASEKRAHITYVHLKKPWPKRSRAKRQGQNITGMASASEIDIQGWNDPKIDLMMDKQYFNVKM
nr:zinc finger protein 879-like [Danaus plexippus plexippus]